MVPLGRVSFIFCDEIFCLFVVLSARFATLATASRSASHSIVFLQRIMVRWVVRFTYDLRISRVVS